MLLVNNISFNRDNREILKDVNLSLSPKQIIYLKGNNGAGKTTLLKILSNLLEPQKGEIFWNGKNIKKNIFNFYKDLTFIMDSQTSNPNLTILENITFWQKLFSSTIKNSEINLTLELLALDQYKNKQTSCLSSGEIKKLELIRLVIEKKKLWLLDEPYLGLDQTSIEIINQTIISHVNLNGMIIFTSHITPNIPNLDVLNLEKYA